MSIKDIKNAETKPIPPLRGMASLCMLLSLGISNMAIFEAYFIRRYINKKDNKKGKVYFIVIIKAIILKFLWLLNGFKM
jgi:hypothetical protein